MDRIAIVDDNETWCFVLALRLQQQGYIVSTFTDTQTFLGEAAQFDLVLIDFSIPSPRYQFGMDGPEVICQVKRQLSNPPFLVLISSFFTKESLNDIADICPEADAILSKQTEIPELLSQIQHLLTRRTSLQHNFAESKHASRSWPPNVERKRRSQSPSPEGFRGTCRS